MLLRSSDRVPLVALVARRIEPIGAATFRRSPRAYAQSFRQCRDRIPLLFRFPDEEPTRGPRRLAVTCDPSLDPEKIPSSDNDPSILGDIFAGMVTPCRQIYPEMKSHQLPGATPFRRPTFRVLSRPANRPVISSRIDSIYPEYSELAPKLSGYLSSIPSFRPKHRSIEHSELAPGARPPRDRAFARSPDCRMPAFTGTLRRTVPRFRVIPFDSRATHALPASFRSPNPPGHEAQSEVNLRPTHPPIARQINHAQPTANESRQPICRLLDKSILRDPPD